MATVTIDQHQCLRRHAQWKHAINNMFSFEMSIFILWAYPGLRHVKSIGTETQLAALYNPGCELNIPLHLGLTSRAWSQHWQSCKHATWARFCKQYVKNSPPRVIVTIECTILAPVWYNAALGSPCAHQPANKHEVWVWGGETTPRYCEFRLQSVLCVVALKHL